MTQELNKAQGQGRRRMNMVADNSLFYSQTLPPNTVLALAVLLFQICLDF